MDHSIPTRREAGAPARGSEAARAQVEEWNATAPNTDPAVPDGRTGAGDRPGGRARTRTRPGASIVCGDSHTSTHGAFGAWAFGIGGTEVAQVLATQSGKPLTERAVEVVFIGSCTNARISDLRSAAAVLAGRRVHPRTKTLVVPGSVAVREQAAADGLHEVFRAVGAEWREPGCSLCITMNGDRLAPGELAVSTSNRNFRGRQGPGGRTVLASPATAAASAVAGAVADPRRFLSA